MRFKITAPDVSVCGIRNGWRPRALKKGKEGVWRGYMTLEPGRFDYRFLVDGDWMNDPDADKVCNKFGTENCVMTVP